MYPVVIQVELLQGFQRPPVSLQVLALEQVSIDPTNNLIVNTYFESIRVQGFYIVEAQNERLHVLQVAEDAVAHVDDRVVGQI